MGARLGRWCVCAFWASPAYDDLPAWADKAAREGRLYALRNTHDQMLRLLRLRKYWAKYKRKQRAAQAQATATLSR